MLYLGLDVHSKWMTINGFNPQTGEIVQMDRVGNDEDSLVEAFGSLAGPLYGVMESGTNSWAVYRMLEPFFEKLIVVDPATVWANKARRKAKTDKKDAMELAVRMYRGELEALYVPDVRTQDLRNLTRARINATRHVTKIINEIGSQLRCWGVVVEKSLLSRRGQEIIEQSKAKLPPNSRMVLDMWLEMLAKAQETEAKLEEQVKAEAAKDETCQKLMSIPGVGPFTALVLRAEIGEINRFGSAEALISYCGLCPSVRQSSESIYYGRLSKFCNRFLKYVLVLRAQGMNRNKLTNPLAQTYWRVMMRGKNNAKVAVARQLTRVIYSMLKNNTCWDPTKTTDRRARAAVI